MAQSTSAAVALLGELKKELDGDLDKCAQTLSKLKIALIELDLLSPHSILSGKVGDAERKKLLIAREALEVAALLSVKRKDLPAFERHVAQVKVYYQDASGVIQQSEREYMIVGLHLLFLLAHNRIAEFHTELELVSPEGLAHYYIQHPIKLEQHIMEGSYSKVMKAKADVPAECYSLFMQLLMGAVREQIASCIEEAFPSVKRSDAKKLLDLQDDAEFDALVEERGWSASDGVFSFARDEGTNVAAGIPPMAANVIQRTMHYATELERIV
eukprot:TRINITY_DN23030_c0_g1_i1.p1 TRINITY_DN23030_c0_g1~~TRINITY_DN23030_c0_g1_i1.p1  ORF type:complete len:271 (-),score=119.38 TRINITY_DN23030_c0_g1_i1:111-923(-)